jgi:fused signal recognition particle receptor
MFDSLRDKLDDFTEEAEEAATEAPEDEPAPAEAEAGSGGGAAAETQGIDATLEVTDDEEETQETPSSPGPDEGTAIDPEAVDDLLWDLELSLLESDVAVPAVERIKADLEERLPEIRVSSSDEIPGRVEEALRDAMYDVLEVGEMDFDLWLVEQEKPATVMFVGVNGTGKTTAIARLAHRLKLDGYSPVLAAGDTYRAGAIEQLEDHGGNLGLKVIKHDAGADAAAVAYDAQDHAESRRKDVVLLDTAGRMQTDENLMDELQKIDRVADPDLTVFVGDALAGNDAVEQAKEFDDAVGVDACILTKVDSDAKGGAALSIAEAVGKPILFLGVGQGYEDLIPYDPHWMVDRIFG